MADPVSSLIYYLINISTENGRPENHRSAINRFIYHVLGGYPYATRFQLQKISSGCKYWQLIIAILIVIQLQHADSIIPILSSSNSSQNYKILIESFKYATKKYKCNLNIIPIYKDLGDDLDNFSKWVEECVNKYNIKYFFGCWRSSERREILPILEKESGKKNHIGFELLTNPIHCNISTTPPPTPSSSQIILSVFMLYFD